MCVQCYGLISCYKHFNCFSINFVFDIIFVHAKKINVFITFIYLYWLIWNITHHDDWNTPIMSINTTTRFMHIRPGIINVNSGAYTYNIAYKHSRPTPHPALTPSFDIPFMHTPPSLPLQRWPDYPSHSDTTSTLLLHSSPQ